VKSDREQDVVAALGKLRDLLQGDVGVAAQVLKALVGNVVIQKQHVDGYETPQMVTRFSINAVPALAVVERGIPTDRDGSPVPVWTRFTFVRVQEWQRRQASPRRSFHSPTTAGRPHKSL